MDNIIDYVIYGIEWGSVLGMIFIILGQGLKGAWHLITKVQK